MNNISLTVMTPTIRERNSKASLKMLSKIIRDNSIKNTLRDNSLFERRRNL
jgi:hypothetical protein